MSGKTNETLDEIVRVYFEFAVKMQKSRVKFSRDGVYFRGQTREVGKSTQFPTGLTQPVHHGCYRAVIISPYLSDDNIM